LFEKRKSITHGNSPTYNHIAKDLMSEATLSSNSRVSRVAQIASKFDENAQRHVRKLSLSSNSSSHHECNGLTKSRSLSLAGDIVSDLKKFSSFQLIPSKEQSTVKQTIFKLESKMLQQVTDSSKNAKNLTQELSSNCSTAYKPVTEPVVKAEQRKCTSDTNSFVKRSSASFLEARNHLSKVKLGYNQSCSELSSPRSAFLYNADAKEALNEEPINSQTSSSQKDDHHLEVKKRNGSSFLWSHISKDQIDNPAKDSSIKKQDTFLNEDDTSVDYEPIYESIEDSSWSQSSSSVSINSNNANNSRSVVINSESDTISLNSESSSLYSDSSSYSSGHYRDSSHLFKNFSQNQIPPSLPPRRYSYNLKLRDLNHSESNFNIANKLINDIKSLQESRDFEANPSYCVSKTSEDFANPNHLYQSIYKSVPSDSTKVSEKSEILNNLIRDLSNLLKINHNKANSLGVSRTPSTLSSSSISRNSSSASEGQDQTWIPSFHSKCENRSSECLQLPTPSPRMTLSKTESENHQNEVEYVNFPNQMCFSSEPLMESISDSSSPQLKEFINKALQELNYETCSSKVIKNVPDFKTLTQSPSLHHLNEDCDDHYQDAHSSFTNNQPLYQFYDMRVKQQNVIWAQTDLLDPVDSIYAELDECSNDKCFCTNCDGINMSPRSHPHMSAMELVGRGFKRLWCEVPQVRDGRILERLSSAERKHQEAMFEVITSEASYLKSLDFLVNHFMNSVEFTNPEVLDARSKKDLFSLVIEVRDISKHLLQDLDKRWQQNVIISDVCDILLDYASNRFHNYIKYITFQMKQEQTLKHLQKQPRFSEAFKKLESDSKCQGLSLISFLLLPMQRITRYPLLIEAILNHRSPENAASYLLCQQTLAALIKVVSDCNAAAKEFERRHELIELGHKLKFDKVKSFPLVSSSRYLLKKCEVMKTDQSTLLYPGRSKYPLRRKSANFLFLFNDLLVIGKKKR